MKVWKRDKYFLNKEISITWVRCLTLPPNEISQWEQMSSSFEHSWDEINNASHELCFHFVCVRLEVGDIAYNGKIMLFKRGITR